MAGNAEESSLFPRSQGVFKRFHLFPFENVPMLEGKPDRDKCQLFIYLGDHLCSSSSHICSSLEAPPAEPLFKKQ